MVNLYKENRNRFYVVLYIYILGIMYFTNPEYITHYEKIKNSFIELNKNQDSIGDNRNFQYLESTLEEGLEVTNCYFFSFSTLKIQDNTFVYGLGIFGYVFEIKSIFNIYAGLKHLN